MTVVVVVGWEEEEHKVRMWAPLQQDGAINSRPGIRSGNKSSILF